MADDDLGQVEFTQYLLPDGRRSRIAFNRPQEVCDKAKLIEEAGFRFEAEVLTTGQVSLTVTSDDADLAFEICENGPGVPRAVDSLVMGFDIEHGLEVCNDCR